MMTPEGWRRIKDCFEAVLGVPPAERASLLDRLCAGDAELRAEVERLLVEYDKAGGPLDRPVVRASCLANGEVVAERYRIIALIGRGGMGEVYRAEDLLLKEEVALKTLRIDLAGNQALVKRFQQEFELARKVTHENVCRIHEVGIHQFREAGRPPILYFTMELLNGETLSTRIRRGGALSRSEAFPIAIQITEGLQAAHRAGVVHADLKSGNIILVPAKGGDKAVITDFGLARRVAGVPPTDETRTMPEVAPRDGTFPYMSPEQLRGESITAASDIYSFGIVLFEMATGQRPFDDRDLIRSAMQRVSGEGHSVRTLVPDIDWRWEGVIDRCLRKEPWDRFRSAGDITKWLHAKRWMPAYWTPGAWVRASVTAGMALAFAVGLWLFTHRSYQPSRAALYWYQKGVDALHSMTYEAARKRFEQAVSADPKFALAHASLARAYDEMDYTDFAKDSILRAVELAQQTRLSAGDERELRALEFMVSRNYEKAAPLVRQMENTASEQDRPAAVLESGWLAQLRNDTEGAAAAYERAVRMDPRYAAAKLRLGFILGRRGGKDDLALQAFTEAENLYSASGDYEGVAETVYQRANLLNRRSRSAEAVPVIERALTVARTVGNRYQEIELQALLGVAARNLGDSQRAIQLARQAIDAAIAERMDNLASSGLFDLGNVYLVGGDPASAEPVLRQAITLAQRGGVRRFEARAQFSLASLAELTHRPEEATQFATAALTFYKPSGFRREVIQLTAILGGAQYELGDYDEGVRVLRDALARAVVFRDNRLEAQVRERLGDNLRGNGDWPAALTEYERAANLFGATNSGQSVQLKYTQLYFRLNRRQDSQRSLSEVQQFLRTSSSQELQYKLKALEAEMAYADGHFGQALAAAGQALPMAARDWETQQELKLIRALALIRLRQDSQGTSLAGSVIADMERSKLAGDAAYARLATAEAFLGGGFSGPASQWARESLEFFERRQIWEPIVQAQLVAAQASSNSAEASTHALSAGRAFDHLKKLWPASALEGYRNRPDFQRLSKGIAL
jgi:tetratricopeptide (TPR) repeat protein/tRNA A-37 threonylcarbamoyl transferase component Bud32